MTTKEGAPTIREVNPTEFKITAQDGDEASQIKREKCPGCVLAKTGLCKEISTSTANAFVTKDPDTPPELIAVVAACKPTVIQPS